MFLEHVDIDVFGPHHRLSIGPLSPGLNAIYGAPGSGKTTIVEFLRAVMLGDARWNSSTAGRVIWCDADGVLVCRREVDGTPAGRLSVERLARDGHGIVNGAPALGDYRLDAQWIDALILPLTEDLRQIRQALAAADYAGFRVAGVKEDHPEYPRLQERLRVLDRELADRYAEESLRSDLAARRARIVDALERLPRETDLRAHERWSEERRRKEADLLAVRRDVLGLEDERRELLRTIEGVRDELQRFDHAPVESERNYAIDQSHRRELENLDARLIRWRRTLREIRGMREELSDRARTLRLDGDFSDRHVWDREEDPRRPLYGAESRIDEVQRRLDWITERYDRELEEPSLETQRLVDVLNSAREELRKAYDSISLREVTQTARQHSNQSLQLTRCEQELLTAIENLIGQRTELLRRMADEYQMAPEQLSSAFGDWRRFEDQPHLYDWLFSEACPPRPIEPEAYHSRRRRLKDELADLEAELASNADQLDAVRRDYTQVEIELNRLGSRRPHLYEERGERERLEADLADIENQLSRGDRYQQLRREREDLVSRLRVMEQPIVRTSRFAQETSAWLARLSGNRLTRFHVTDAAGTETVDGRALESLSSEEIRTVSLAVRLAAVEALARQGRTIPLVVDHLQADVARCVIENAKLVRQIVFLTNHAEVAQQVQTCGGKVITLHGRPTAAPVHYGYEPTAYSGRIYDVNRELDTAWRETYGLYDNSYTGHGSRRLPFTRVSRGPVYADGCYEPRYAENSLEAPVYRRWHESNEELQGGDYTTYASRYDANYVPPPPSFLADERERRFFLTEASAVDQAPSVDAVVAARLRGIGIHRVGQLLAADPDTVADRLGLAAVNGRQVQQWQNEARMVCQVPRLRPFDARVLVGCGVVSPRQLAEMHPTQLLDRVQAFLATERGRHILKSGSSYELSRITNWIVSAGRTLPSRSWSTRQTPNRNDRRHLPHPKARRIYDRDVYSDSARTSLPKSFAPLRPRPASTEPRLPRERYPERRAVPREQVDFVDRGYERPERSPRPQKRRREETVGRAENPRTRVRDESSRRAEKNTVSARNESASPRPRPASAEERSLRFFLNRRDAVVDAPTIGPQMAERLAAIDIHTVADLLDTQSETIARRLGLKRVTSEIVRKWQLQAAMVCQVPQLRGHDAQLLVSAGVNNAEQLASYRPDDLLELVTAVARTADGKRFLRGNAAPDLNEVSEWIRFSSHRRELAAA